MASGSLLQFITREDFYFKGIPNMGFYGQFEPLVQGYSCAESPFWLGKIFLCLDLPEEHPFWSGERKEVLYRRQFFTYTLTRVCHWMQAVSLADFPVPKGIFRADRLRLFRVPVLITLGHGDSRIKVPLYLITAVIIP